MKRLGVAALFLMSLGCGSAQPSSQLAGRSAVDAVTAKLRETFLSGRPAFRPSLVTYENGWNCLFHATTNAIVYRGISDFEYHSNFTNRGVIYDELAENVHTGSLMLSSWQAPYAMTDEGLRSDGRYHSRVIRQAPEGALIVEWSYNAAPGDLRGDESIAIPGMRTAGYSVCNPGQQL